MLGRLWFIEFCIRTYSRRQRDEAYRYYVTDTLRILNQNVASFVGGGSYEKRFYDIVNPPLEPKETSREIIDRITSRLEELDESV